jgi:hypothetical protein
MASALITKLTSLPIPTAPHSLGPLDESFMEKLKALQSCTAALSACTDWTSNATLVAAVWEKALGIWCADTRWPAFERLSFISHRHSLSRRPRAHRNACVVASNTGGARAKDAAARESLVQLRQLVSDLTHSAGPSGGDRSQRLTMLATFATKTGEELAQLGLLEQAEVLFSTACDDCAALESMGGQPTQTIELALRLYCARARTASALGQGALVASLLEKADVAASALAAQPQPGAFAASVERLGHTYFDIGKASLASNDGSSVSHLMSACAASAAAVKLSGAQCSALQMKALQFAAVAQLKVGEFEQALVLAHSLEECASANTSSNSVLAAAAASALKTAPFCAVNALIGLGRAEAGDALVAAARGAVGSGVDMLIESLSRASQAGLYAAAAAAILMLLCASPSRSDVLLRFVGHALAASPASAEAARSVVLELLDERTAREALRGAAASEASAHPGREAGVSRKRLAHLVTLLWNCGAALFESKDYGAARRMFAAVLAFQLDSDTAKVRAARAACLCHLALREADAAERYIVLADELEAGAGDAQHSVQTKFLRLKCALELGGDDDKVLQLLATFKDCADDELDFMLLVRRGIPCCTFSPSLLTWRSYSQAALEAQSKKALRCAQAAFSALFESAATPGSASAARVAASPGYISQLLRHLVKVTQQKWDSVPLDERQEQGAELASQFAVAAERLQSLGADAFAGADARAASKELAWFAAAAWNAGLAAAQGGPRPDWAAAAQLFGASAAFAAPAGGGDANLRLSLLLSAAAWLEVDAAEAPDRAAAALGGFSAALEAAKAAGSAASPRESSFFLLLAFTCAARRGDADARQARARTSPSPSPCRAESMAPPP